MRGRTCGRCRPCIESETNNLPHSPVVGNSRLKMNKRKKKRNMMPVIVTALLLYQIICGLGAIVYKSSAVAEMGDSATIVMGRKEGAVPFFVEGKWVCI